ncbi:MAG: proline--tRNA ligase [Planctomycetota bacterium]|nr:proline--tRNA ligase [Planctomycetota bacterium]
MAAHDSRPPTVSSVRRGVIHRWSRTLIPTAREAPADAEVPSHVLLHRAGFIRPVGAGIYDYLPLAWRTLRKISDIVREEMDAAGGSEMLMPALEPVELFAGTKRDVDYGDNLFKLTDRKGRTNALAPTHEEVITDVMRTSVNSYKQLPLNLYQIQTKFRDEARPRAGLLRCREFIMKDAYSFHAAVEGPGGLNEAYDAMYRAYTNIFTRCGLDFSAVEAESGPIGGSASHEFMVNCASGEDTVLKCPASGYAANVEKCEIGPRPAPSKGYFAGDPSGALEEVHTPNCPGIDDVCKVLKVKPQNMLKSVLFKVKSTPEELAKYGEEYILAVVRGDHDVNEGKVKTLSRCKAIELADPAEAIQKGFAIGFISPRAAVGKKGVLLLVDRDAAVSFDDATGKPRFWVTGGDKKDYHVKHFNWQRDLGKDPLGAKADTSDPGSGAGPSGGVRGEDNYMMVGDVRNALEGDPSPRAAGSKLVTGRGIEVGHIFKLGTKYSDAMGFSIPDDKQQRVSVIMGCYGIGVSRTMAACVEMSHDEHGIRWPAAIAPYHVLLVMMKPEDARQIEAAARVSTELAAAGVDVLIDDRDERPGVKFKDADLVGIPLRLTLGDKALDSGGIELKARIDPGKGEVVPLGELVSKCLALINA